MASLTKDKAKNQWRIQFKDREGKRRWIRLPKVIKTKSQAAKIKTQVENLVAASISGTALSEGTADWVKTVGSELRDKLATAGLLNARVRLTLPELCDRFIASKRVAESTKLTYRNVKRNLTDHFGTDKAVHEVSSEDALGFYNWMLDSEVGSENTARRRTGIARQIFRFAVTCEWIHVNPFKRDDIRVSVRHNKSREHYVTAAEITAILDKCPNIDWKLIFALTRYAAMRCPSEVLKLRWSDIHWDKNKMIVTAPKTEHAGKPTRPMKIMPELYPILREAFESPIGSSEFVVSRYRDDTVNLRTNAHRIIKKAAVAPWSNLFNNLRKSCVTDLKRHYPEPLVHLWVGHTKGVSDEHYSLERADDYDDSKGLGLSGVAQGVALTSTPRADTDCQPRHADTKKPEETVFPRVMYKDRVGRAGLEPNSTQAENNQSKSTSRKSGGATGGAFEIDSWLDACPLKLSPAQRELIAETVLTLESDRESAKM